MSDLDRLIRYATVADELSFSRAAKKLGIDQPWLSRQIQQLEEQLGFPLLARTTRTVELTPDGELLLKGARELAEAADRARDLMRRLQKRHQEILVMGVN